jgi:hypothetical protein
MNRQIRIKFLFTLFFLAVACSGIKTSLSVPAPANEPLENTVLCYKLGHVPNAEAEVPHLTGVSGVQLVVQKNFAPLQLLIACNIYKLEPSENLQIQTSSLFIRAYLSHIYPTHNFW